MPWQHFKKLFPILASLAVSACRTDSPPPQELCALNGVGLGDCIEPGGAQAIKPPSQMVNYVCRSPATEQAYDAWCYNTSEANVAPVMQMLYKEARR